MSVSRRKFMQAGIVAAACAGLPLKSALAAKGSASGHALSTYTPGVKSPQSLGSIEQLGYYNRSTFAPHINSTFRVRLNASSSRELRLVEVSDYLATLSKGDASPGTECFSLLFTTSQGKAFSQDTYLINHEALGAFYMFLAGVSAPDKKSTGYYEAVFYRGPFHPSESTVVEPANAEAPAEPARAPWRVSEERVVDGPMGERHVTIEREVYSFSSLAAGSAEVESKKKKKGPNAHEREIALSMAQAPVVSGLKLGMKVEDVLALFPGSRKDKQVRLELARPANRFGMSGFTITPRKYSSETESDLANQIVLRLLDGRVYSLYVGTDNPVWEHVDEFVTKFSEENGLPGVDYWEAHDGLDGQLKTLKAKDFELSVFAGGQNVEINYVRLIDAVAQRKLKARQAESRAQKLTGAKR